MVEFREIRNSDIPEVSLLYIKLLLYIKEETKDPYFDFNLLPKEIFIDKLNKDILDKNKKIFIAVENSRVIGFIAGEIIDCFLPFSTVKKIGYISSAYVSEDYRNKGIIKNLEVMITHFFKEQGIKYVELNVISNNFIGKKTWNKLGYTTFREQMRKKL